MIRSICIAEEAKAVLQASAYSELRGLDVKFSDRRLLLQGAVHSFYMKQLAQELLRSLAVAHGCRVANQLDVMDVLSV